MSFVYRLVAWLREETGQTMAEYGLILALISIVAIAALIVLGPEIRDVFNDVRNALVNLPT